MYPLDVLYFENEFRKKHEYSPEGCELGANSYSPCKYFLYVFAVTYDI